MGNELQDKMKNALDCIYDVFNTISIEIRDELRKKLDEEFGKNTFSVTISRGHFKNFHNYIWISIENLEDETYYSINLFYNSIDLKSANPIVQFGRFQFWKDVIVDNKDVPSPHECLTHNKDVVLYFLNSKSYDPNQAIYDGTYNLKNLVSEFIQFYNNSIKE